MNIINISQASDKYIYTEKYINNTQLLYIGKCIGITNDNMLIMEKSYYFTIPSNNALKCFCYDNKEMIEVNNNMNIYHMSTSEFVNTFRNFVKYDGTQKQDLPNKIVQDI